MMADVVALRAAEGSLLATVSLFRMPDGSIRAVLDGMPVHVIEDRSTITARFVDAGFWCLQGGLDLMQQAVRFDPDLDDARTALGVTQ